MALWLRFIFSGRAGRVLGALIGLTLTVGLLATLGGFVVSSAESMTRRATAGVPVDWQIQVAPGVDVSALIAAVGAATPYTALQPVEYADTAGFAATTGDTTQTAGPGKVLGVEPRYASLFPGQIQPLLGAWDGVLILAQTAANLHVSPGDTVTIMRVSAPPVDVKVAGVIALPNEDAMFQAIAMPKGLAPQAPPDNVLVMPSNAWHRMFDVQRAARPDTATTELHVRMAHERLASDPVTAYIDVQRAANNFEVRAAGQAAVANNLAARLDSVRSDALYARVLFLFLGGPGVILALLVTLAVADAGMQRRIRDQALLRLRGASILQILRLAWLEAAVMGTLGVLGGLALAVVVATAGWGLTNLRLVLPWFAGAALVGLVAAAAAFLLPAWRYAAGSTVLAARTGASPRAVPLWQRLSLDCVLLAIGVAVFVSVARSGYELVLAPEGVQQTVIHYDAFIAPLCLWIGASLLWIRLVRFILHQGQRRLASVIAPLARGLAPLIAASLSRQRDRIARGVALVSLAFAFAATTAIFDATYSAQSHVDAELTNGADVTVTGSTGHPAGALLARLRATAGVVAAEPLMHRYAYVGADLQDLFGIDPMQVSRATTLSNAYFANHDAAKTLAMLASTPDGVLVSDETVADYELRPGDRVNLRLQNVVDHQYHVVPFRFVGVAREFPTAPKDSFLVANAAYIAQHTGSDAAEVVLVRAPTDADSVARAALRLTAGAPGLKVTTLGETHALIGSSLTAVDLAGLTQLELGFSVLMIAGVTGLVLGLGLAERRRSFTILSALGAKRSQVGSFLWVEGLFVIIAGAVLGLGAGAGIAGVLVAILAGVFDPPPEALSIPWLYLASTAVTGLVCGALAIGLIQKLSTRPDLEALRGG
ncbi:ABC transporter permease [Paraburkholderia mimosarum]|uniref:ABC transporter permease n=1 Tax=Paraburkholderia mimosarum TaxID=312026 RepID=UPI0003FC1D91|nr:ABC transporter permease [Paraburkholderia mimosarum]